MSGEIGMTNRKLNITMTGVGGKSLLVDELEMPIEQFAEAVAKENARLRAVLESIAEGGFGDNAEDAYDDVRKQAREALK